ncbi:MAG: ABC transporter ATP-binding protein [Bacteroidota bacterium]
MDVHLQARNLRKEFGQRLVFRNLSFSAEAGNVIVVAGRNGAGKSTLLKIVAGLLTPTEGEVKLFVNGRKVSLEQERHMIGFVAPYLQLYDEFTGIENMELGAKLRGKAFDRYRAEELLRYVGLESRFEDPVGTYSSGMKQRLKYAFAILYSPPVLVLDEPSSNLDQEGTDIVRGILSEQRDRGVALIATNEPGEKRLGDILIDLDHRNGS